MGTQFLQISRQFQGSDPQRWGILSYISNSNDLEKLVEAGKVVRALLSICVGVLIRICASGPRHPVGSRWENGHTCAMLEEVRRIP